MTFAFNTREDSMTIDGHLTPEQTETVKRLLDDSAPPIPDMPDHSDEALLDVMTEMERQVAKWGPQNHPSFRADVPPHLRRFTTGLRSAAQARQLCEDRFRRGEGTWADIAIEEICEAFEEPAGSEALYVELIQCAAVFASWAASVKRNAK